MLRVNTTHSPLVEPDVRISLIRHARRLFSQPCAGDQAVGCYKYTKPMRLKCSYVQFFFNETKSKHEVSRFWFRDSRFENPVVAVEKRLPYLPQDRRSRFDPYLGYPPR